MRAFFVSGVQSWRYRGAVSASLRCAVRKPASFGGAIGAGRTPRHGAPCATCKLRRAVHVSRAASRRRGRRPHQGARCRDQAHWRLHPRKRTLADVSRPSTM